MSQPKMVLIILISLFTPLYLFILGIGYHNICSFFENIKFWHPNSDQKTMVRGNNQNNVQCIWFVFNTEGGKPTFVTFFFSQPY